MPPEDRAGLEYSCRELVAGDPGTVELFMKLDDLKFLMCRLDVTMIFLRRLVVGLAAMATGKD